mgnify:FL=1
MKSDIIWLIFAFGSAFFAGITSILAKCGIRTTDSSVATAIRTIVVFLMAVIMVIIAGTQTYISEISIRTWVFLILSGLATGGSWLCYFKALQIGDINKVVPIDKSSTVLAMIMAFIFLKEDITLLKVICMFFIGTGTLMMIENKTPSIGCSSKNSYLPFAFMSAIFAALTSILGKIGIENIDSNLGTAIRTFVVLIMAWLMVGITKKGSEIKKISKNELAFICFSGLATGCSWLCYYKALQIGPASVVVPIDKLSIIITVAFSYLVFKEKLTAKSLFGLVLITVGTLGMLL